MTTPSGTIGLSDVNTELGYSSTALITMNDSAVRTLAGVGGSGTVITMNDLRGKSNRRAITVNLTTNQQNVNIYSLVSGSYIAGKSDITINVSSGVYIGASSTGVYAMTISGFTSGDTVRLNNSGYILGCGGAAGSGGSASNAPSANNGNAGSTGGNALYVSFPTTVYNYAYIWSGGGGGGGGAGAYGGGGKAGYVSTGGGGGGGGAGYSGGSLGAGGSGGNASGSNGASGSTTAAGGGGAGAYASVSTGSASSGSGGSGGANGYAGSTGGNASVNNGLETRYGGGGGATGYYVVGNSNITWGATGDRRGNAS